AVAFRQIGDYIGMDILNTVSFALILLSAFLVSGAVIYSSVVALRQEPETTAVAAD
ncbi:sulfite exporter TauE/SafE family protein, partial [Natribaculum luteum]